MSLGIVFKGPEGIVLVADSRVTLNAKISGPDNNKILVSSYYDNASKLLKVNGQDYVGVVTYGLGALGEKQPRTAHSFIPEFENLLKSEKRLNVKSFAIKMSAFFMKQWKELMPNGYNGPPMIFIVGGYNSGDTYGKLFEFIIPEAPKPVEKNEGVFGLLWGGQRELTDRLVRGFDDNLTGIIKNALSLTEQQSEKLKNELTNKLQLHIPYQFLPLQDCIDLAILLVKTTATLQTFLVGIRGVGGAIDVGTITKTKGFYFVQQKEIRGEL